MHAFSVTPRPGRNVLESRDSRYSQGAAISIHDSYGFSPSPAAAAAAAHGRRAPPFVAGAVNARRPVRPRRRGR